jgi:hypothetical protein
MYEYRIWTCAHINGKLSVAARAHNRNVPGWLHVWHLQEIAALGFLGTMEGGDRTSQQLCHWDLRRSKPCRYPVQHLLEHPVTEREEPSAEVLREIRKTLASYLTDCNWLVSELKQTYKQTNKQTNRLAEWQTNQPTNQIINELNK